MFRTIVNLIMDSPILLKALRDKQNDPSLHFNFEFESTVEDIETDNDQFITEYLHWGNTRKLTKDVVTR